MHYKYLLFLFSLTLTFSVNSQDFILSGKVKDSQSSQALAFCSIALLQSDSMIQFAITDEKGYFEIPAKAGEYVAVFRYVGYMADSLVINLKKNDLFLGIVNLKPNGRQLAGTEIKASVNQNFIDKDEYLVTSKMRAGAANTSEVVEKVNGINYDRFKNKIKVDNDPNIIILVNGLEKDQEYIKNLNPDRIAKVEIIRDPSGKYGIEGFSAIVNVVLKTHYQGNEVFISSMNMFDIDSQDKKYIYPINNFNANYNYTKKNFNAYTQLSGNSNRLALSQKITKNYSDSLTIYQLPIDNKMNILVNQNNFNLIGGADYQINSLHTLSFEASANYSPTSHTEETYQNTYWTDSLIHSEIYSSKNNSSSSSYSLSGFYIGNFSDSKNLRADMSFFSNSNNSQTEYGYDWGNTATHNQLIKSIYSKANIEWTQSLSKKASYQLGYGNTYKKMTNKTMLSDTTNTTFNYDELRNKAFVYGIWKPIKKITIKMGLAIENSLTRVEGDLLSFWIYKPHFDLLYKPTSWLNAKVKYRVDSRYPSSSEADPTEISLDNFIVQKGNPNLIPTAINKASVKLNILNGLLSAEAYYHFSNNYITPIGKMRNDRIFEYNYANAGNYIHRGIKFNLTIPMGKQIFWQNNADLYHSEMTYEGSNNTLNDWSGESQLLYVNQKNGLVSGILYQRSNSKVIGLQGYSNQENDYWGFLIQKPFYKKQFNIMLLYMLPINWNANYTQTTYLETPFYTQESNMEIGLLKNLFLVQLSYRFHRGKEIKTIEKKIEKEAEKKQKTLF